MTQEGNRQTLAVLKANKFFGELSILGRTSAFGLYGGAGGHKGIRPDKNGHGQAPEERPRRRPIKSSAK